MPADIFIKIAARLNPQDHIRLMSATKTTHDALNETAAKQEWNKVHPALQKKLKTTYTNYTDYLKFQPLFTGKKLKLSFNNREELTSFLDHKNAMNIESLCIDCKKKFNISHEIFKK